MRDDTQVFDRILSNLIYNAMIILVWKDWESLLLRSVLTVMDCTILHILANCDVYKVKLIFEYLPACRNMELIE